MIYLMDSNACIGWLRQREPKPVAAVVSGQINEITEGQR
jgi:hypothetical protein